MPAEAGQGHGHGAPSVRLRLSAVPLRTRHSRCPRAQGFHVLTRAGVPQTPSKCKRRGSPVTDSPQKPRHLLEPELVSKREKQADVF